jgi:hypothetical protein
MTRVRKASSHGHACVAFVKICPFFTQYFQPMLLCQPSCHLFNTIYCIIYRCMFVYLAVRPHVHRHDRRRRGAPVLLACSIVFNKGKQDREGLGTGKNRERGRERERQGVKSISSQLNVGHPLHAVFPYNYAWNAGWLSSEQVICSPGKLFGLQECSRIEVYIIHIKYYVTYPC